MSFVVLVFFLLWLVAWPIIWFAYFKTETSGTPAPKTETDLSAHQIAFGPKFIDDTTAVVAMRLGGMTYLLKESDAAEISKRLHSMQINVRTLNEANALK